MIPRKAPSKTPEKAAPVPAPYDLVEVRDIDINLGVGDTLSFTLGPEDAYFFDTSGEEAVVNFAVGEVVRIRASLIRWSSVRIRKQAVPPKTSIEVPTVAP